MTQWSALPAALTRDSVTLTWAELSRIVGELPDSATNHRAWWSGDRPHVRVWRAAGYTVTDLRPGHSVTFVRTGAPTLPKQAAAPTGTRDIVLVACAKTKLGRPAAARDLYISPGFVKSRAYAEGLGVPWFILSAEYGLLPPSQLVAPYDRYLPDLPGSYRAAWGAWTVERLELLAGRVRGRTVEVHAGAAYVDAIAPHLATKGALLAEPLHGLRQGERQAWYDAQPPRPAEIDAAQFVGQLTAATNGRTPAQVLATGGAGLKLPGLYSWWVDRAGAEDLARGLGQPITAGLIYAGLAGATRWPSGSRSTNTLWSRIVTMHLGGNHEFSTFRRTLGAVLANAGGLDRIDEERLTAWMNGHLTVVTVPYLDADTLGRLEELVLREIDPPLNLRGMAASPIRAQVSQLRRVYSGAGRS